MDFFRSMFNKGHTKEGSRKKEEDKDGCEEEITIKSFINQQKGNFNECVICLQEMKTGEKLSIISCSHIYHTECIEKWSKKKKVCPLCDYNF